MGTFVLTVLAEALKRTAKTFSYCAPNVPDWMLVLARNIEQVTKEFAKRDGA